MKIRHPHVSRAKARHTAASLTIMGGIVHYVPVFASAESVLFAVAGVIAIYVETLDEPHIIRLLEEKVEHDEA